ncbi:hypothetical protein [Aequorivita sp. Q41]|uniref:hypothetical protein n=1 Tax=Aequorivita sp. Q41 TaxID=3153300 RepID=UPI003241C3C3
MSKHLLNMPFVKKGWEKEGVTAKEFIDNIAANKYYGENIGLAGGVLISMVWSVFISTFFLVKKTFQLAYEINSFHFFLLMIPAYLICYFHVFRKNIYLKHFEFYEKWSKHIKHRNIIITFLSILFSVALFVLSVLVGF